MAPLDGVRVIALEQAVAAPLCTRHLADLGAEVIKIERVEGDFARRYDSVVLGQSAYFVWLNRGKRSVALDLSTDAGRATLDSLLADADVFVHNLGPGAVDRLGLDWESVHARWPRLLSLAISGYGAGGPYGTRKSYDLLVQAEAGLLSVTGSRDEPAKVGISIADICGGMYGLTVVLAALRQRERDGLGRRLEVSLFDGLAEWMTVPLYYELYRGAQPKRTGMRHGTIAPYGPFECADGVVVLAVQNEREWTALCERVLERPDLLTDRDFASNEERVRHRDRLEADIESILGSLSRADVERRLAAADVPFGAYNDLAGVLSHPQLVERGRWTDVETPNGAVRALRAPFSIDGIDLPTGRVPALDQDGARIRHATAHDKTT